MNPTRAIGRNLLAGVVVLACALTSDARAQYGAGRIVYFQEEPDGSRIVTSMTGEETSTITLPPEQCTRHSDDLTYLASSDLTDPDYVEVYDLDEGTLILQVPWQPTWTQPCGMVWDGNDLLTVTRGPEYTEWDQIDLQTGTINSYEPIPLQLPGRFPGSFDAMPSPSGQRYVYKWCSDDIVPSGEGWSCMGSIYTVIYDVEQQVIVEKLGYITFIPPVGPVIPDAYFAWSPSGRYLVYPGTEFITIYDTQQDLYVDVSAVEAHPYLISTKPYGMQFSPDETKLILWGNEIREGYPYVMVLVDIEHNQVEVWPTPKEHLPDSLNTWAWTSDSHHILVNRENGDLVQVDVITGAEELVAQNVTYITSWYPGAG